MRIRRVVLAASVAASLFSLPFAPAARAGGMDINVTGPERGGTYRIAARTCGAPSDMRVEGRAEGRVGEARRSIPLDLRPTSERGVLAFHRTWPAQGRWVLRFTVRENGRSVSRIAPLSEDGRVIPANLLFGGDGRRECEAALAKL